MTEKELMKELGGIREEWIVEAEEKVVASTTISPKYPSVRRVAALAACLLFVVALILVPILEMAPDASSSEAFSTFFANYIRGEDGTGKETSVAFTPTFITTDRFAEYRLVGLLDDVSVGESLGEVIVEDRFPDGTVAEGCGEAFAICGISPEKAIAVRFLGEQLSMPYLFRPVEMVEHTLGEWRDAYALTEYTKLPEGFPAYSSFYARREDRIWHFSYRKDFDEQAFAALLFAEGAAPRIEDTTPEKLLCSGTRKNTASRIARFYMAIESVSGTLVDIAVADNGYLFFHVWSGTCVQEMAFAIGRAAAANIFAYLDTHTDGYDDVVSVPVG